MRLLLNYRPVLCQPSGIGVVANAVLPALQELPHVLIPGGEQGTPQQRLQRLAWTQIDLPRLARKHHASLVFTPAPEGYLCAHGVPQVVMVHDLRPVSHPEYTMQSIYFRSWVPKLLRQCQHVLTNSYFTAREIQRMASIPEEKITVLRLGYDTSVFTPAQKPLVYAETPYLLHVGQAYPHKNLRRLIRAFAQLAPAHRNIRLVLAGKSHYKETPILKALVYELGLVNQVEFLSYVSPKDLPELYRQALALVYPSLWEGFGLPVLEAMACGTPVICSHGSGAEEVAKHAALLVDPTNTEELRAAMQQVILDEATRTELSKEGVARSATFSWDITRKQIVDFFHRLS